MKQRVESAEVYKVNIVNPFGFKPLGLKPPGKLGDIVELSGDMPENTVTRKLTNVAGVRQAELILAVEFKDPLSIFLVQINGKLTLRLRRPDAMQDRTYVPICHTFDPRILHDGENQFLIGLSSVAGYAVTEASKVLFFALMLKR